MITQVSDRIYMFQLPIPFPIKTTNVCFIDDSPRTLIDTGIKTEVSLEALRRSMETLGFCLHHIERILITHGHIDHYGQAKKLSSLRYPSLRDYLTSLEKVERMDLSLLLPGHGEMIHDPKNLIQKVFVHHRERTERITGILSKGDKTPFDIAMDLFPGVPPFEVFLGISEAVGHLEILREEERVRVTEKEGIDIYSLQT